MRDMKPLIRAACAVALLGGLAAAAVAGAPLLGAATLGVLDGDYDDVEPLEVHSQVATAVVDRLREHHLIKAKRLDDEASGLIFDKYLEFLDAKRMFLLASDIAQLESYRTELDDALREGDLAPAFDIYNVVRRRALDRVEYEVAVLREGLAQFDFDVDESILLDREDAPWPETEDEAQNLWRLVLKSRALGGRLAGDEPEEIAERLTKRVRNNLRVIRQTRSEDVFQLFINAFAQTYDKHTQYFSPRDSADFNIHMSLSLEGIGAVLGTEDEYTVVHRLVKGGPAELGGGIKPTDRILAVAQSANEPFVDIVGWRTDEVVELIRGPKGSPVLLKVMPKEPALAETRVVEIVRDVVKLEEQAASKSLLRLEHAGSSHSIGVVTVPTFYIDFQALRNRDPNYTSTTRDVAAHIQALKDDGMDGLIIDLRNNGGGSLQEAVELTGLFVESGPVVQVANLNYEPDIYNDVDEDALWNGPLAVIVNGYSASASEIFAGAIQDYGLGVVVGGKTFGKGTVQSLIALQRGELKLTERQFFRVSGEGTEQNGVTPDIAFPLAEGRYGDLSPGGAVGAIDTPGGRVPAAQFRALDKISPVVEVLRVRHAERTVDDAEFAYLRARKERFERLRERTHLSLREDVRRAEKEADDAWLLEVENARLVAKGEQPAADVSELADRREAEAFAEPSPEDDTLVRETANIVMDLINLSPTTLASAGTARAGEQG